MTPNQSNNSTKMQLGEPGNWGYLWGFNWGITHRSTTQMLHHWEAHPGLNNSSRKTRHEWQLMSCIPGAPCPAREQLNRLEGLSPTVQSWNWRGLMNLSSRDILKLVNYLLPESQWDSLQDWVSLLCSASLPEKQQAPVSLRDAVSVE